MQAGGFTMILPDGAVAWSKRKVRWHEVCYMCGKNCKSTGRSVPGVGRTCETCFSNIVREGLNALKEKNVVPEFRVSDVEKVFAE